MSEEQERFLQRWSRRKVEAREAPPAPAAEPAQAPVAQSPGAPDIPTALPPVEELTPQSDFKPFMDPRVDPTTRRAALKRLFSDAHFNVPDPFEAYSEDYTLGEPIPLEMLKTLNHARKLIFDEAEKSAQSAAESPAQTPAEIKDGAGRQDA